MSDKSTERCVGCRNHFYNGNNPLGVKQCWSLEGAKIVTRYRIGTWVEPTRPGAFTKVRTYHCHQGEGYAHVEELPSCAKSARSVSGSRLEEPTT